MLTALDAATDVIQALRLGANDYAVKPLDFPQLLSRVQTHLALRHARDMRLGKYLLREHLGSGAMGSVYAATDTSSNRPAAVKVLSRSVVIDSLLVSRFMQEAALMAKVHHPNIVQMYEAGREGETLFLAMELVEGPTLEAVVRTHPLPLGQALSLLIQMASALAELHSLGIVHRDIKPQNVLLAGDTTPKITDFGVALDLTEKNRLTQVGVGVGSLLYSSPEQLLGNPDMRADMYGLGATAYYLLTAEPPFSSKSPMPELFERKFAAPPDPTQRRRDLPQDVAHLVMQLMAPRPEKRFAHDAELASALEALRGTYASALKL